MQLKSVIIDDEKLSRDLLNSMLNDICPQIKVVGQATNPEEGVDLIINMNPDVVFLDIEMNDKSGFDILNQVSQKVFQTVFVTGYSKYSIKALKTGAADYLLKPIDAGELKFTTCKLIENHINLLKNHPRLYSDMLESRIALPHFNGYKIVNLKDIIHLNADNHYTYLNSVNEPRLLLSKSIGYFEEKLNYFWFFRVHKSHIINLYHFKEYLTEDGGYALMRNGEKLPISRLKLDELLELLNGMSLRI
jgi:two-component system, LytTR family, response regulator